MAQKVTALVPRPGTSSTGSNGVLQQNTNSTNSNTVMCKFNVVLGDFIKHRHLSAKMTGAQAVNIGELVVALERNPNYNPSHYPSADGTSNSQRRDSTSDAIDYDLSVESEKFKISAKEQLRFLTQQFSSGRRLRRSVVKSELLAFKRAILRDYNNRLMKFTMAFENLNHHYQSNTLTTTSPNQAASTGDARQSCSRKPPGQTNAKVKVNSGSPSNAVNTETSSANKTQMAESLYASRPSNSHSSAVSASSNADARVNNFISFAPPMRHFELMAQGVMNHRARLPQTNVSFPRVQIPNNRLLHSVSRPPSITSPQPEPDSSTQTVPGAVPPALTSSNPASQVMEGLSAFLSHPINSLATTASLNSASAPAVRPQGSGVPQVVSVSTLAAQSAGPDESNRPDSATGNTVVSSSTSPQNERTERSNRPVPRKSKPGDTSASAIDLEAQDVEESADHFAPPAKKMMTVKQEPSFGDESEHMTQLKQTRNIPVPCNHTSMPPEREAPVIQTAGSNLGDEKVFKCWLCDFTFKEKNDIEHHLRQVYQRENDPAHSHAAIAKAFGLDNPAVLLLDEKACVFLKCLKCDEIQPKLSLYLIHAMMVCPFTSAAFPSTLHPAKSVNVFDVIKKVEHPLQLSPADRDVISGANEIAVCGQVECGALLNRFDSRPHKCTSRGRLSILHCRFYNCKFEGDKKHLISHYCLQHTIRLTNVQLSEENTTYLNRSQTPALRRLLNIPVTNSCSSNQMAPRPVPINSTFTQRETVMSGTVGIANQSGPVINPVIRAPVVSVMSNPQQQQTQQMHSSPHVYPSNSNIYYNPNNNVPMIQNAQSVPRPPQHFSNTSQRPGMQSQTMFSGNLPINQNQTHMPNLNRQSGNGVRHYYVPGVSTSMNPVTTMASNPGQFYQQTTHPVAAGQVGSVMYRPTGQGPLPIGNTSTLDGPGQSQFAQNNQPINGQQNYLYVNYVNNPQQ